MRKKFARNLIAVTIVHLGVVLGLIALTAVHGCFRSKPAASRYLPIEFVVLPPESPAPLGGAPEQVPENIPEPRKKPAKVKQPSEIRRSTKRIRKPGKNRLVKVSSKEIREMMRLAPGGRADSRAPTDDALCRAMVRQTFYDAWVQPSYSDVGAAVATVTIGLGKDGIVTDQRLAKSSGNAILDASVIQVMKSVKRIPGLTASFLARHKTVTISFKLEE